VAAVEQYLQGALTREQLHAVCDDAEWPYQDANLRAEDPENRNPEPDRVAESAVYAAHMLAWPWFPTHFAVEVAVGAAEAAAGWSLPNVESAAQAEVLRSVIPYPGSGSVGISAEPDAAPDRGGGGAS
jgi:hypothetical protein